MFFDMSMKRITKEAEDNMEFLSAGVTDGVEHLLEHWEPGTYQCARCGLGLYSSEDKWRGPCPWPSFRKALYPPSGGSTSLHSNVTPRCYQGIEVSGKTNISTVLCDEYNGYKCSVEEVYCGGCDLFVGHQFEVTGAAHRESMNGVLWRRMLLRRETPRLLAQAGESLLLLSAVRPAI